MKKKLILSAAILAALSLGIAANPVNSVVSAETTAVSGTSKLVISSVVTNGDFTGIVGTWHNDAGEILTVTETGLSIIPDSYAYAGNYSGDSLSGDRWYIDAATGNEFDVTFLSVGGGAGWTTMNVGDTTKDRIIVDQYDKNFSPIGAHQIFYKVEESSSTAPSNEAANSSTTGSSSPAAPLKILPATGDDSYNTLELIAGSLLIFSVSYEFIALRKKENQD